MERYDALVLGTQQLRIAPWLLGLALFVLAFAAFAPAFSGPFLFDDRLLIEGNYRVHSFDHWTKWLTGTIWDTNYDPSDNANRMPFWRPLVLATFALDWTLGAGSPLPFHLTNLLLHALNSVLLWWLLRKWFRARGLALGLALLFALHPAQSEVVCWISGRGDSLCLMGLLIALHGLRRADQRSAQGTLIFFAGAALAFAAKEMAIALPILVVLDRFARSSADPVSFLRRETRPIAASSALVLGYLFWRSLVFDTALGSHAVPFDKKVLLVLEGFGRAVALYAWPLDTTLGRAATMSSGGVLIPRLDYAIFGAVVLAGVSLGAWRMSKSSPRIVVGWLGFLGAWLPVSGIIPHGELSLISPRYLYIPFVPVLFMLGAAIEGVFSREKGRTVAVLSVGVVSLGVLAISLDRSGDFTSNDKFWRAELEANPTYVRGQDYFIVRELRENRPRSALRLSLSSLALNRKERFELLNAEIEFHVLEALAAATPDIERDTLRKVAEFADNVAQGQDAVLELPGEGVTLRWTKGSANDGEWAAKRRRLFIVSGDLWSRLGEDGKALRRVEMALEGCEQCWTLFGRSAIIRARAGELGAAAALAESFDRFAGPSEKGQLRESLAEAISLAPYLQGGATPPPLVAQYYSSLLAFGRAYDVARPAFEDPPDDPGSHQALAELALRAGDRDAARKMLGRSLSPPEIEAWEREKLKNVLWHDADVPEGTWMPE
jgi:hypothetical protein